ncbi:hypothetical protein [Paenibacillus radicis (ex Gao et al. 2016)]|uniref:Uncharacterized protein n=1 Tax=Paenibacillus radicis (ex Gao et al. 2016) TaxID=1737354 RepID=A0A917H510_9BACL|nr:hypothetical protein [Paenibacillus radicis (ex Gao et al. 2016)]GGG67450.1 hypothetical protein GCM10010918_22610 [Paenibacillus radicis (ex Gao et al. 2016)]
MSAKRFGILISIIMVWITILAIVVLLVLSKLFGEQLSVHLTGIPGQAIAPQMTTIQMDKNEVWIIDPNSNTMRVITKGETGYHVTVAEMSVSVE